MDRLRTLDADPVLCRHRSTWRSTNSSAPHAMALVIGRAVIGFWMIVNGGLAVSWAADGDVAIGWTTSYETAAGRAEDATLRAIAFSPLTENPAGGKMSVGIAVGDHGVILRVVLDEQPVSGPAVSRPMADRMASKPWRPVAGDARALGVGWNDVIWLSDRRVVVVGGNFEPVTGLSRGAAAVSDDAGRTWRLADADQVTRLRSLRRAASGPDSRFVGAGLVLEAIGDPLADSGLDAFVSLDGGRSWSADAAVAAVGRETRQAGPGEAKNRYSGHHRSPQTFWIRDTAVAPGGTEFAVGDHGRIAVRDASRGDSTGLHGVAGGGARWRPIRGEGRRTGVLFVVDSVDHVPWALVGRESLELGHRVGVLVDTARPVPTRGTHPGRKGLDNDSPRPETSAIGLATAEQAATSLGAAYLRDFPRAWTGSKGARSHDADPQANTLAGEILALRAVDPIVLALPAEMSPSRRSVWVEAAKRLAQSRSASLQRVCLTELRGAALPRPGGGSTGVAGTGPGGILLSEALLPRIAVTAGDLWYDALMLVEPGRCPPAAIGVIPLWEARSNGRSVGSARNVSLAGGLLLPIGCQRTERADGGAARRRLQMTTARMSQTQQFQRWLGEPRSAEQVGARLDAILSTTAEEDRSRLLWQCYWEFLQQLPGGWQAKAADRTASSPERAQSRATGDIQNVFLDRMERFADHPALRRWAKVKRESRALSAERNQVARFGKSFGKSERPRWSNFHPEKFSGFEGNENSPDKGSVAAAEPNSPASGISQVGGAAAGVADAGDAGNALATAGAMSGGGIVSPFQIRPVGFENSFSSGATTLLVPQAASIRSIAPAKQTPTCDQWEYHPSVMAARQVSLAGRAATRPGSALRPTHAGQAKIRDDDGAPNEADTFELSRCDRRPRLDARLSDSAWRHATWWQDGPLRIGGVADAEFVYLAVLVPRKDLWWRHFRDQAAARAGDRSRLAGLPSRWATYLQLALDTDGDLMTQWNLAMAAEGAVRTTVDHHPVEAAEHPRWLAAIASAETAIGTPMAGRQTGPDRFSEDDFEENIEENFEADFTVLAELALPRAGWGNASNQHASAGTMRIRLRLVGLGGEPESPAMPDPRRWRWIR